AYLRLVMAFETFAHAGVPSNFAFPVRVQQNGAFFGLFDLVEKADDDFLQRVGLDPNGALYKVYLRLDSAYGGVAEKKTRQNEPNDDLQALIDGCNLSGPALRRYLYDNIDIPEVINFLATIQLVQNEDCCRTKNYFLYRDTEGSGQWQMLPWDLDLTFGRTFHFFTVGLQTINGYFDTNIYWTNLYYSEERATADFIGANQRLANALLSLPEIDDMFFRRWTTVQEEFLQPGDTHPLRLKFERRVDELSAQVAPDAVLDLATWGTWTPFQTQPQAAGILKSQYFAPRRGWIFNTLRFTNGGPYLGPQPTNTLIRFGDIEYNPSTDNQAEEYLQLTNANNYAVDISGWKITGAVDFTFRGGTVLPALSALYVSPDVRAFRARTSGPRGGQGLFVVGNYQGQLSARGESLQLLDQAGLLVGSTNYLGAPSLAQQYLRVSEIMYHPAPPPPGLATNTDEFEFIEVKNIGPVPISLDGVRFANGIEFNFSGSFVTSLAPAESAVVVRNLAAFQSRYGPGVNLAGPYAGLLDNQGENIRLEDASGEKILDFDYNNTWYPVTDGLGFSLVIVDENAPWDTWGLKASWRPSSRVDGSPGQMNPPPPVLAGILVNEVLTHTDPPSVDGVELYNPSASAVNLGGWFISDDFTTPKKFRIPDGTIIASGGFRSFDEHQFNPIAPPSPTGFSFSAKGDEVYLFSGDANTNLTGYFHGFAFGAAAKNVTFGRHVTSVGQEHFLAQKTNTLGGVNDGPLVGPVVLSEIHYHPPDLADGSDNAADEFVELQNISGVGVNLFDPLVPANTWHLRGVVDFDFPPNLTLGPSNALLVVNFNPTNAPLLASFRSKFGVPSGFPVFGPYAGKLDNSSGSVRLSKPDAPVSGEIPYILVDEVDYTDSAPWPSTADGAGASLQRLVPSHYGNDPVNWTAAAPTAGRPFSGGAAPAIVMQPASQAAIASAYATLSVGAVGLPPLRYQWRFNGANITGATNSLLTIPNVLGDDAGVYTVAVFNDAGSVESSNAVLTVLYGAYFSQQPQNLAVKPGFTATFVGIAMSAAPFRYQWRFNGADLPGATNLFLAINNAQFEQNGVYQVIATDNVGSVPSAPVTLTVLIAPVVTQQPLSQTVVTGAPVAFSVSVSNTAA
ncbi:MAG TPA: lamin tail domain-containing protein, partial [Verrucomicrobiae bacterium]